MGTPFNAEKFKSTQKAAWTSVAEGWHTGMAPSLIPVSESLISFVEIPKGSKVLDLACGDGTLTLRAAAAGAGEVTASDLAPSFEAIIKRRAKQLGFRKRIRFQEADMENLPFEEKNYDIILCQFGLMFAPNLKKALQEIYRVLSPQGKFGAAVWGSAEENSAWSPVLKILADRLPPRPEGIPTLFDYGAPRFMEVQLHSVGFRDYQETRIDVTLRHENADAAWEAWRSTGPFEAAFAQFTPETQKEVETLVREHQSRFNVGKKGIEVPARALLCQAKRGFETLNFSG